MPFLEGGQGDQTSLPPSLLIYMLPNGGHIDMRPNRCQLCGSLNLRTLKPIESYSYLADWFLQSFCHSNWQFTAIQVHLGAQCPHKYCWQFSAYPFVEMVGSFTSATRLSIAVWQKIISSATIQATEPVGPVSEQRRAQNSSLMQNETNQNFKHRLIWGGDKGSTGTLKLWWESGAAQLFSYSREGRVWK